MLSVEGGQVRQMCLAVSSRDNHGNSIHEGDTEKRRVERPASVVTSHCPAASLTLFFRGGPRCLRHSLMPPAWCPVPLTPSPLVWLSPLFTPDCSLNATSSGKLSQTTPPPEVLATGDTLTWVRGRGGFPRKCLS